MAREIDVWQTAWIIADQFGAEGVSFAARMAHSFQIGGKTDAQNAWLSIMEKVQTLTARGQSNSTTAQ